AWRSSGRSGRSRPANGHRSPVRSTASTVVRSATTPGARHRSSGWSSRRAHSACRGRGAATVAIDLSFDEHQLMLQQSAGEFFRRKYPSETVRAIEAGDLGYSPEDWAEMARLGWLGITIPEQYGGVGGRFR